MVLQGRCHFCHTPSHPQGACTSAEENKVCASCPSCRRESSHGLGVWKGQLGPVAPGQGTAPLSDSSLFFLGSWTHPTWTQMPSPMPASPGLWTPNQTLSGASAPSMRPLSSNHPLPVSTSLTVPCHPICLLFSTLLPAADAKAPTPSGPALLGSSSRHCIFPACTYHHRTL